MQGFFVRKEEIIKKLQELRGDEEEQHIKADQLLLEYINDVDISRAFEEIKKWYS